MARMTSVTDLAKRAEGFVRNQVLCRIPGTKKAALKKRRKARHSSLMRKLKHNYIAPGLRRA